MSEPAATMPSWPRFLPSGDHALTVELGEGVDRAVSARVVRLHRHLLAAPLEGMAETMPTFRSLLVQFDPRRTDPDELERELRAIIATIPDEVLPSRRWAIPVCYDAGMAPDLAEVASLCGMSAAQVVECQSSPVYYVYMLGFLPGYGYLGDVPEPLRLPRRKDPRTRVPAGSLAIATGFASIYPFESPGGWHIIGRSPLSFFDQAAAEPALLAPGDEVRFEPIAADRFDALRGARPTLTPLRNGAGG